MSVLDEIVANVARRTGMTETKLRFGSGHGVRDARQAVFFIAAQRGLSSTEVAAYFDMDHNNVLHGMRRMETLLAALVAEGGA